MRHGVLRLIHRVLQARSSPLTDHDLARSAVVFSPHYDDEALGCGGTIIRMIRNGTRPKVVFLTDGGKSHRHLLPESRVSEIRAQEAIEANLSLGLERDDIIQLSYEDSRLSDHVESASRQVGEILADVRPEIVFVPYRLESPPDHFATRAIVRRAFGTEAPSPKILEYPIWFWHHWPSVPLQIPSRRDVFGELSRGIGSVLRLLVEFDRSVEIEDALEEKRAYLNRYRSQMTRLVPDERWKTLGDVADGEFLRCFFGEREYFHTALLPGGQARSSVELDR